MRYLFRGLIRETGRPVEGHVEAANPDEALKALSDNAIVTESLVPDPKPVNFNEEFPDQPELASAIESAFDSSSSQINFDDLTERYRGKKVWVIDRDKIRRRVCQVVDQALQTSEARGDTAAQSRQRVQQALQGMFSDNRNIASERNADSIAGVPAFGPANGGYAPQGPGAHAPPAAAAGGMEEAINRLVQVVSQAEKVMASMALAARNFGRGGGGGDGGGSRRRMRHAIDRAQNDVLLEIFKANLELAKSMTGLAPGSSVTPAPQPQPQPS
ncbi:MAG TPA: hypothetical protein VK797_03490 [Tepidisphaeraceae bacterium]|nr:hypothetical protein [Tepidisphaeraceae bacterium]